MNPESDPLETELEAFEPRAPSPKLEQRIANELAPGFPLLRRRGWQLAIVGGMAAAILVAAFTLWNALRWPFPVEPSRIDSPMAAIPLRTKGNGRVLEELGERSLAESVADAQVIVVATALDAAPAPPKVPGDLPEFLIRFKVKRVLKGELTENVITTRTPTAPHEFIGKEGVILLSPEYMAGIHQFANWNWIKAEPEVIAILAKGGHDPTWRAYRRAMAGSPEALEELFEMKAAENAPRSTPMQAFIRVSSEFPNLNGDL